MPLRSMVSTQPTAVAKSMLSGFSHSTALPAAAARSTSPACVFVALAMTTPSMPSSANTVSASAAAAPLSAARSAAAVPAGSTT